jgi:hypothetical protein
VLFVSKQERIPNRLDSLKKGADKVFETALDASNRDAQCVADELATLELFVQGCCIFQQDTATPLMHLP